MEFYDALPKDQQQALDRAAREVATAQRKEHFEREAGWIDRLKAGGKLEVNDVDLAAFAAKLRPLQDEFAAASRATDVVSRIKAL